ncbi:MAG: leucyl/phenylalanyl-tRNA--protein transferase [Betaproteobacteria bacterium]|jgi:leucyl/phenylalanyl-tRNA---protein transferase|nr:MAG: leucyl/phenylalanyl-tRNA--protein transferase [Betaproteobacteria bacterium]
MIHWLAIDTSFPSVTTALVEPNGLLAAGADLSVARLLSAYRQGIFPWFSPGQPILWWSPDPRMVLFPTEFRWHRSLRQRVKKAGFEFRLDTAFAEVMQACAAPRGGDAGTWIVPEMQVAYQALHAAGHAHSAEIWVDGVLVGGLYGVAIGRMFYGESMFSRVPDGSKLALALLCERLVAWGFELIDCQMETAHLASLGARPMARAAFVQRVARLSDVAPAWAGASL